jgi:hypothetical protein
MHNSHNPVSVTPVKKARVPLAKNGAKARNFFDKGEILEGVGHPNAQIYDLSNHNLLPAKLKNIINISKVDPPAQAKPWLEPSLMMIRNQHVEFQREYNKNWFPSQKFENTHKGPSTNLSFLHAQAGESQVDSYRFGKQTLPGGGGLIKFGSADAQKLSYPRKNDPLITT